MKFAILGPQDGIHRVRESDTPPSAGIRHVEITDEQAAFIASLPVGDAIWIDGAPASRAAVRATGDRISWDMDAGKLVRVAPPAPPARPARPLRQSARVVLSRLTPTEKAALRACTVPAIQDAYDVALIEGTISEADPEFPAFRDGLAQLGIIAADRWAALLAP